MVLGGVCDKQPGESPAKQRRGNHKPSYLESMDGNDEEQVDQVDEDSDIDEQLRSLLAAIKPLSDQIQGLVDNAESLMASLPS